MLDVAMEIPDRACLSHTPVNLNSPIPLPSPHKVYFRPTYTSTYELPVAFDPAQNVNTVELCLICALNTKVVLLFCLCIPHCLTLIANVILTKTKKICF